MGSCNYILLTISLSLIAFVSIKLANKFIKNDPSEIVIDEFVGCLFTFIAIKINFKTIILGFILFRIFDITKIFGIKRIEKLNGATGILLDDIAAGILSNLILQVIKCYA